MATTTFILGAGASFPYGLPLGSDLSDRIFQMADGGRENQFASLLGEHPGDIKTFVSELRHSACASIDAFLGKQPQYSHIGKKAIAATILSMEGSQGLYQSRADWYAYVINALDRVPDKDPDFTGISVVTFNYDRSFERYMLSALMSRGGLEEEEASERLSAMRIVHVYGDVGSLDPRRADHVPYGIDPYREAVEAAARNLRVIPEGRDDDACLLEAHQLIYEADTVAILGFGFDPDNLRRIKFAQTCHRLPNGRRRKIVATTVGLTEAKVEWISAHINGGIIETLITQKPQVGFRNMDVLSLLRHELIFGDGY